MKCSNCGLENPPGVRYCEECGASLETAPEQVTPSLGYPAEGSLLGDKYRIGKVLREGVSRLYEVTSVPDEKLFWAEEMPPHLPGEGVGLVEALRDLDEPHLWRVEEIISAFGREYFIGEALEGQYLESLIGAPSGRLQEKVRQWGLAIAEALEAFHGAGLLHRDIQPAHLFLTSGGILKLRGFHRLCRKSTPPTDHLVTQSFSPPEFYGMFGGIPDERSDFFSLGAVLYFLMAGSYFSIEERESFFIFPSLSGSGKDVEPALEDVVLRAVSKDPAKRFATASEMVAALRAIGPLISFETEMPVPCTYALSIDRGKVRPINQDACLALEFICYEKSKPIAARLFIVADGMGGEAAGEKASSLAVRAVARRVVEDYLPDDSGRGTRKLLPSEPEERAAEILRGAISEANALVHQFSQSDPKYRGMGSTLTAALLIGSKLCIGHCGDSRAYLLGESIEQISEDHSLVGKLVRMGQMSREESLKSSQRSVLYRALGTSPAIEVDVYHREMKPGEMLLLMSDGVWEYLDEEELLKIAREKESPRKVADECLRLCLSRGADDNCTILAAARER